MRMQITSAGAALLLLALTAPPALAQEDCQALPTQAEVNQCAEAAWQAADQAMAPFLEAAGQAAARADFRGDGQPQQLLEDAQTAWTAFRDATCAAEARLLEPGTGAAAVRFECLTRLTTQRQADLQTYAGLAPAP